MPVMRSMLRTHAGAAFTMRFTALTLFLRMAAPRARAHTTLFAVSELWRVGVRCSILPPRLPKAVTAMLWPIRSKAAIWLYGCETAHLPVLLGQHNSSAIVGTPQRHQR